MDFVTGCVDLGGVREIVVLGIASIDRISEHLIRVGYYSYRDGENVFVAFLVWDLSRLLEHGWQPFETLRRAVLSGDLVQLDGAERKRPN